MLSRQLFRDYFHGRPDVLEALQAIVDWEWATRRTPGSDPQADAERYDGSGTRDTLPMFIEEDR